MHDFLLEKDFFNSLLDTVVRAINAQSPEFVCITGDLIGDVEYLPEALEGLQQIRAPLFGVPGNHDYWSRADFDLIGAAFARTGGRWLQDESVTIAGGGVHISGFTCNKPPQLRPDAGRKTIVLIHYPAWVDKLGAYRFDVALAGHSHGGQ